MTIIFTEIYCTGAKKFRNAASRSLNILKAFSQIKKPLLFATALLSFAFFAAPASGQVTITTPGATTLNEPGQIPFNVNFTTAQTGVSASNFSVTGTSTTSFAIGVTGSGTSYNVTLTVLNGARTSGTVVLNMVNSNGVSPGVGSLPLAGPSIQVNYPTPSATLTLTSTNANPGYAKTGDQVNYTLTTNGYNINYAIITAGGNQIYNSGTQLPSASGSITLGSSTPQGAIAYDFSCDYTIGETAGVFGGSGTSGIIFDTQPPTASISAPSATIVGNSGTSSVSYTVNYADANFGSSNLTAAGITLNTTGTASGTVSVTGSGTSYVVTISNILGTGTLGISLGGGYATDLAGNTDTGAGASQTVNVSGSILPAISSLSPASGPVGTLVTINGTNLSGPTAFSIGGVPAIVVSDNGSTLVGLVMPGAVTGAVSFTSNGGNAGGTFTVTPTLFPALQQGSKLVGKGNTGNARQGISVAVSADGITAIVGGYADNNNQGAAWVYTRSAGIWKQQGAKLVGNDAVGGAASQGNSVAISADGKTAIVGGPGDNGGQGAAWVYTRTAGVWTQQGPKLVGTGVVGSYGASQGYSVAISADGNTALVGGYYDNSGIGAVWVYTRSGGTWTQQGAKLVGTGAVGSSIFQGWSVSLSADGNTAITGGWQDNSNQGAAWVYTRSGGVWTQQGAKLVGSDVVGNSTQGFSVSISADGNTAIVGGKGDNTSVGAAWVYTRSGGVWSQQGSKLVGTGAVGAAEQGVSVSLTADGNTAMVGGWFDNSSVGAAWVYTRSGGAWTQQGQKLVGTGGAGSFSEQGSSVSLSADGNTAIAGGFGDNNSLGAAWAYISLQAPTVQAGSVTFTNTNTTITTASWTNGNGTSRAVFMYAGSSGSPAPVNNNAYNANAAFGLGDQIGSSGWYCVYNGTGSTVNITGLTAGATYQLMVVEYNGTASKVAYLSAAGTGNPAAVTTLPPPPPTITAFSPATGPVGTLVTVSGTNLAAPTAFTVGGVPAVVVSNNGSTLVGMVMPGAVTGSLSFTTLGGSAAGSGNFTVTATLYPSLQQGPKLVGTGNIGNAGQGYSVAVSADGNTAIVGGFQDNSGMGAAWIYTRSGGIWSQQGSKLVGTGAVGNAGQGGSAAISADGNTVIVGAAGDNMGQGAAWVFTRNGGTWTQQGSKLVGTGAAGSIIQQGFSVSLSADGNTAIVGSPFDNGGQGALWVYMRNAGGIWTQQGSKLVGTGAAGNAGQGSSVSLSADGNTAIAGAVGDNGSQGAAWVYTRSGGTWTQQGSKLVGTGAVGNAGQGASVSLSADGNTAIVGGLHDNTQGAAWVYTRSSGVWTQQGSKLVGTDATGGANSGNSVSLSADGNTAIVGGQFDNQGQGAVWVYTRSSGVWSQQGSKLVGAGAGATGSPHTGSSVSISADGNTAMAGGFGDNGNIGAAWVYVSLPPPTVQAGNVTFTSTTTIGTTASWTNGNGSSRAVFMYAGSSGTAAPVNNTAYNANATFGIGDQVGSSGWYCVYNGTGNAVNITGLTAGTTYQVMVVEYNGSGSNVAYLNTAGTGNPATVTTLLPQPPTIASFNPSSGPVGTLVTINGTNLATPTAFTIGGAPAIVVSNDGSTLVGMVMPGAATGPLSFTTAGGTAAVGGNFNVTATSYPSLQQGTKLVGTGAAGTGTNQGRSVAVSADGNTAIVGGWQDNNSVGAAWVYTRTGGVWTQQGSKLVGTGAGANAGQGMSVSISADGNTAIVGGPRDNVVVGAAWVYTRSGGTWTQQGSKLVGTGSSGGAQQGTSVSLSADGNTAIVGGWQDNNGQGAGWVYTRAGGIWKQQGSKLVGTSPVYNAKQGASVSLSADGNTAIVGGSSDNSGVGAVWIYTRTGTTWAQQGPKLVSTDAAGSASQGSSVSLSADGNTAIVGGLGDNSNHGAAWIYTRSAGVWTQQGSKLAGTDATTVANIGASVSLSADGNTAILGGYTDNSGAGAAWVYTRSGGTWTQQGSKLVGTGAAGNAGQGGAVSLSADGNTAMSGGFSDNSLLGAAWVYVASVIAPTMQAAGVTFTNTTAVTTTASWTNGNGSSRAVFMFAGSSGSPAPVYNNAYYANAAFGTGGQIGSTGWYCVYNGTGSTVNITGLTAGTTYQVMVVEYNGSGSNVVYLTTAGSGNPASVSTLSNNARLSGISLSGSYTPFSPSFTPGTTSYTTSVDNTTSSVTVTPTTANATAKVTVNGMPVTSGTASGPITLAVGANVLTLVVTAQDGVTITTYTITVTRKASSNAALSALKVSQGSLSPAFSSGTAAYGVSVANGIQAIKITPTTSDAGATVTVNGTPIISGATSAAITLNVGQNIIPVVVTAADGVTQQTYIVTVTRAGASNANLAGLSLSSGTLNPAFGPGVLSYTVIVINPVSSITITPTSADVNASVKVNGTAVSSGTTSASIPLTVGQNTITVTSTAQDGVTTKAYTIVVTREPLNNAALSAFKIDRGTLTPAFSPTVTSYSASVVNGVNSFTITPTTSDPGATVKVNGTVVASGTASGNILLSVGTHTVYTKVTAEDGITSKIYALTITRAPSNNANLSLLKLSRGVLSPVFTAATTSYTSTVTTGVTSVTITPTTVNAFATLTVNGTAVTSGSPSGAIALAIGVNNITVHVTAQDGTTQNTYTVAITRAADPGNIPDASLSVDQPAGSLPIEDDVIVVHSGLSPNGDGINDFLQIDGIQAYPDNKLSIMNRNGQLVYEAKGYDNASKVFDGHSNKTGQMQLPGTYFYSLEYTVRGVVKHKTGYLVLKY